jgi:hypothetical protein
MEGIILKNAYEVRGNITAIFINNKKLGLVEVLISTNDLELVKSFPNTWFLSCNGHTTNFYAVGMTYNEGQRKGVKMHRLIMDAPDNLQVDHMDRNTFNNTRDNLRVVTSALNAQNRSKTRNNTSGHTGVRWHKPSGKWQVSIQANNKNIYLGTYTELMDAVKTRKQAEEKYWRLDT